MATQTIEFNKLPNTVIRGRVSQPVLKKASEREGKEDDRAQETRQAAGMRWREEKCCVANEFQIRGSLQETIAQG